MSAIQLVQHNLAGQSSEEKKTQWKYYDFEPEKINSLRLLCVSKASLCVGNYPVIPLRGQAGEVLIDL